MVSIKDILKSQGPNLQGFKTKGYVRYKNHHHKSRISDVHSYLFWFDIVSLLEVDHK